MEKLGRTLTYELCKKEALKYNSIVSMQKSDSSIYNKIHKKGWTELLSHINLLQKPTGYWTKGRCHEAVLKCSTRKEIQGTTFYNVIIKNGWTEELTSHLDYVCRPNYWTKETCHIEALKYNRRVDLQKGSPSTYNASLREGWLDEVCSHMKYVNLPPWTYETAKEEAIKYITIKELVNNSYGAYQAIIRNGWNELLSHIKRAHHPNGWWTYDKCKEQSDKYNSTKEFRKNSPEAYKSAKKNGWYDELTSHMEISFVTWTKEMIQEEALKWEHRSDFYKGNGRAYGAAIRNKCLAEVCSHMKWKTTIKERYIYSFEFEDNSVYIGLSYNPKKRKNDHLTKKTSKVYIHIKNTGCGYKMKILIGPIPSSEAGELERETIKKYKDDNWNILNVAKGGALGGSRVYWTYNKCKEQSIKYNSLKEYSKDLASHVKSIIIENGWWDELISHMIVDVNLPGYWDDKTLCHEEASKYGSKSELQKGCPGAYKSAARNGWLDDMFPLTKQQQIKVYWSDKKNCHKEALKYNSRTDFSKLSRLAYRISCKNGWMKDICSHMRLKSSEFNKDTVLEEARKYYFRNKFREGSPEAVTAAKKNDWWEEAVAHMDYVEPIKWKNEDIIKIALEYDTISKLQKGNPNAYNAARRNGCTNEAFAHMQKRNNKPRGYWDDKNKCRQESLKHNNISKFQKGCSGAYKAAKKNGWIHEFFLNK